MKKTKLTRSLLAACSIVALTAVMYGCVHDGGDSAPVAEEMPEPTPEPDPEPTDLENAQAAAMAAADAAKTASDSAAMAASDAGDATANLATAQTGAMAMSQADKAQMQADAAMAAYMAAKAASDVAAAATDATAAIRAQITAEAEQAKAEAAAMKASEYGDMAMASAMGELMIDGTMKSVGDTTVDAEAPKSEVTSGSGDDEQKTITGLLSTPMTTGAATDGRTAVPADLDSDPPVKYVSPMVNAAERSGDNGLKIGKVVDSADDMARLEIITAYASTQAVKVYASDGGDDRQSHKAGMIRLANGTDGTAGTDDDIMATLRPVGMFYQATTSATITATSPAADGTPAGDTVAATAKAQQVYSFVDDNTDAANPTTHYVVKNTTTATTDAAGETTTAFSYSDVAIHVAVDRDGITGDENVFVTAALPAPKSYSHIHFGAWASLGEAAKDGSQKIAGLGIGFVQSIGDGMTGADMQNAGTATYNGNWVATVQEAHPDGEGTINLLDGGATLTANFDKEEITAMLANLATLKGDISGNTFSGDAASGIDGMHGLDSDATFTGSFSGGFYGAKNAEAGGIFDFASEGNEGGAFVGAFGGAKQADE